MKKTFVFLVIAFTLLACNKDNPGGLVLNGTIENLKVGTVYLQKIHNGKVINLDSVVVDGKTSFSLNANLEEPQLLYVYLNKKDATDYNDRIAFFATDTIMQFTTDLYDYDNAAIIVGGKNQELYNAYTKNSLKLGQVYTELLKRELALSASQTATDQDYEQLEKDLVAYVRKKVLYTVNYANNNKESEIAPYLLLQETSNANPKLLDSIYNMMPKKIQSSLYGKELSEFLKKSKE